MQGIPNSSHHLQKQTCNQLDLETLGFWLLMPKISPAIDTRTCKRGTILMGIMWLNSLDCIYTYEFQQIRDCGVTYSKIPEQQKTLRFEKVESTT